MINSNTPQQPEDDTKIQIAIDESLNSDPEILKARFYSGSLGIMTFIFIGLAVIAFLLSREYIPIAESYAVSVQKSIYAALLILVVLILAKILKKIVSRKVTDKTTVYNFGQIVNLLALLLIGLIGLSFLFANWYAAMVSFGVVSLILGLALQNPISSFFGWLYILLRKPYEVGDRIKIGNAFGDVIRVSYIDTTLWECKGDYLTGDHPSGRIIKFANSKVFSEYVFNYSWPLFPYIWNELRILVSHDSDLQFVSESMQRITEADLGETMMNRVKQYKDILSRTPVDQLQVAEHPGTLLRVHDSTWIEVSIRYLVEPKNTGAVRKRLFLNIMKELRQSPDKVRFPANA
ncbi:MAG: mechanosensitive ion channel [Flavobacterium sp.]|nr:mechanosensitive ion channel [Flavobacterium sp.]